MPEKNEQVQVKAPATKNTPQNNDEEMLELMHKFMGYVQVADQTQVGSPYAQEALDVFRQLVEGV